MKEMTNQNCEVRAGGVGKWASSVPILSKKSPVRLLPSIAGMLDGANQPINPNPITLKSLRSQSLWKLHITIQKTYHNSFFFIIKINIHRDQIIQFKNLTNQSYNKNYHVTLPPFPTAIACLKGFLAVTCGFPNPGRKSQLK